jgi:hypothetical protein
MDGLFQISLVVVDEVHYLLEWYGVHEELICHQPMCTLHMQGASSLTFLFKVGLT